MTITALELGDIFVRIILALVLGGLIGLERELTNHPAGIKTHALVCIGSALASLVTCELANNIIDIHQTLKLNMPNLDVSRIAAGVVTGIGFIGTGAIMKAKDSSAITGITTAATIWVTGCLGLAIGMGYIKMSLITFVTVFISNTALKYLEKRFISHGRQRGYEFTVINKAETLNFLNEFFSTKGIKVTNSEYIGKLEDFDSQGTTAYRYRFVIKLPKGTDFIFIVNELSVYENIVQIFEMSNSREGKKKSDKDYSSEDFE